MNKYSPTVLSHAFGYNVSMLDFRSSTWMNLPDLKTDINEFELPWQLLQNAKNMGIKKLTSCQSAFMTHFFQGNRSIDYILHTPHLSGLTSGVAFCMIKYVMDYYEYDHTRPRTLSPMIIVMCEKDDAVNRTYNIFSQISVASGVSVYNLRQRTWQTNIERCGNCDILVATPFLIADLISANKTNIERCGNCDILVATPFLIADLISANKINLNRIRFIFVDWADKVYNAFQLPSTTNLVRYLGERNNAVRILGCEHLYESRREYFAESCRDLPVEIRVQQ
uniref:ATP-dependent RNA helicase n=1 Tax=Panagrolaimus sp. ES5 TaxID=591445 RepID=A0AC34GD36_9BILA